MRTIDYPPCSKVVMLVFKAPSGTAIRAFDKATPTFHFGSSIWKTHEKHFSNSCGSIRCEPTGAWTASYQTFCWKAKSQKHLFGTSSSIEMSINLSFPKYQFNVIFSMLITKAYRLGNQDCYLFISQNNKGRTTNFRFWSQNSLPIYCKKKTKKEIQCNKGKIGFIQIQI